MNDCNSTDDTGRAVGFGTIVHSTWSRLYGGSPCITRYMAIAEVKVMPGSWWVWPLDVPDPDYLGSVATCRLYTIGSAWHIAEDQEG